MRWRHIHGLKVKLLELLLLLSKFVFQVFDFLGKVNQFNLKVGIVNLFLLRLVFSNRWFLFVKDVNLLWLLRKSFLIGSLLQSCGGIVD